MPRREMAQSTGVLELLQSTCYGCAVRLEVAYARVKMHARHCVACILHVKITEMTSQVGSQHGCDRDFAS